MLELQLHCDSDGTRCQVLTKDCCCQYYHNMIRCIGLLVCSDHGEFAGQQRTLHVKCHTEELGHKMPIMLPCAADQSENRRVKKGGKRRKLTLKTLLTPSPKHFKSSIKTCYNPTEEHNSTWFSKNIKPWFWLLLKNQTSSIRKKRSEYQLRTPLKISVETYKFNWWKKMKSWWKFFSALILSCFSFFCISFAFWKMLSAFLILLHVCWHYISR